MKLACNGGPAIRTPDKAATWPIWGDAERKYLNDVLESGVWSYNGPFEKRMLGAWKAYVGTEHALAVANGTVSLQLALEALDIGWGDEVILPGVTWQATAACVLDVNAVPVLVDVEPDTWCIDPAKVEAAITDKTKAIIVVHLYGNMPDMDRISAIARDRSIPVIEDCAHQHGAEWRGKRAGNLGTVGSFSLQLSKVLTAGEGGLLTTNDADLWTRLDALRNCGRRPVVDDPDETKGAGAYKTEGDLVQSGNYRITEFQAAVVLGALDRIDDQIALRERNGRAMDRVLDGVGGLEPMKRDERQTRRSYFNYAFRFDGDTFAGGGVSIDRFRTALSAELGVEFDPCYEPLNDCTLYRPLTKQRYRISDEHVRAIDPSRFSLPVSERMYAQTSVTTHHSFLMGDESSVEDFSAAIEKIAANADELR